MHFFHYTYGAHCTNINAFNNKRGKEVELNRQEIRQLISYTRAYLHKIELELRKVRRNRELIQSRYDEIDKDLRLDNAMLTPDEMIKELKLDKESAKHMLNKMKLELGA